MEESTATSAGKPAIRPMNDRVLVRQEPFKQQLNSGLYIPQGSREGYEDEGVIESIGPKVDVELLGIKVGDRVKFKRRAGSALIPDTREGGPLKDKDYLLLKEEDLLCVVED